MSVCILNQLIVGPRVHVSVMMSCVTKAKMGKNKKYSLHDGLSSNKIRCYL